MPQNVDQDVAEIKRFLSALQKKNKPKIKKEVVEEPKPDRFRELVNAHRAKQSQAQEGMDLIERNLAYSPNPIATLMPGVIPAKMLGYTEPNELGTPMGLDLNKLKEKEREEVFSRLPLEDQERLVAMWSNK